MGQRPGITRGEPRCMMPIFGRWGTEAPILMRCRLRASVPEERRTFCGWHGNKRKVPDLQKRVYTLLGFLPPDWEARSVLQAFACGDPNAEAQWAAMLLSHEQEKQPLLPLDPDWVPIPWRWDSRPTAGTWGQRDSAADFLDREGKTILQVCDDLGISYVQPWTWLTERGITEIPQRVVFGSEPQKPHDLRQRRTVQAEAAAEIAAQRKAAEAELPSDAEAATARLLRRVRR